MSASWQRIRDPLLDALFTPFPPVARRRQAARAARRSPGRSTWPARGPARAPAGPRRGSAGAGGRLLLTGNAMHADVPPDAAGSGIFGWLLAMLGQDVGFPVPQGGAGRLAAALALAVRRRGAARSRPARGSRRCVIAGGRAVGVRTADGRLVRARRAVLADVDGAGALPRPRRLRAPAAAAACATSTASSGTTPRSRSTGRSDRPIPWTAPARAAPAPCTSGSTWTASSTSPRTCRVGRMPDAAVPALRADDDGGPDAVAGGHRVGVGLHPRPARCLAAPSCRGARWSGSRTAVERGRARVPRRGHRAARPDPGGPRGADANLVGGAVNGGTAAHPPAADLPADAGLGRPETPVAGPVPGERVGAPRAAGCTAPAAGTRPARHWVRPRRTGRALRRR